MNRHLPVLQSARFIRTIASNFFYSSQVVHIPEVNFAGLFIGRQRFGTHQGKWSADPLGDVSEIAVPSIDSSCAICSRPKPPVVYIRDVVPLLAESWLHGLRQETSLALVPAHFCGVKDEFLVGCNRINILS